MFLNEDKMNVGGIERAARLAAGAWILNHAMKNHSMSNPKAWVETALGAEILMTGVTGYSFLNNMIGRDSRHA